MKLPIKDVEGDGLYRAGVDVEADEGGSIEHGSPFHECGVAAAAELDTHHCRPNPRSFMQQGLSMFYVLLISSLPAFGDAPCGFASSLLVCRRAGVHLSTFWAVVTCCFCGGCGHLAQKGGLAVYVYLRFCCGALIRSSVPSSVWLASGLQSKAYFARACLGCPPSS